MAQFKKKVIGFLLIFFILLVFPGIGQAEPHLLNVYINQTLAYNPNPVYLTATALYSDGSVKDVTYSGAWRTSNPSIASVYRGKVEFGSNTGNVTITFSYGGFEASVGTEVVDITDLEFVTKTLKYSTQPVQLKVQGRYNNGELQEIKDHITWYSTNEDVATVNSKGLVSFRNERGVATIGVIFTSPLNQRTVKAEITVTVTEKDIEDDDGPEETKAFTVKIEGELDPSKKTNSLKAIQLYIDDSKKTLANDMVQWTSSNPTVAEVNSSGQVTYSGRPGNVTITVKYRNYSDSKSTFIPYKTEQLIINESLNFTPYFLNNPPKLTVTGKDNSGQTQLVYGIQWSSSNENVAAIDSNGQISFTGQAGNVTFSAVKDGVSASITATVPALNEKVIQKIFINPSLFYSTQPQELKAYALMGNGSIEDITKDCRWTSTNASVASVNNGTVFFTGLPGTVEILCSYQNFTDRDKLIVSVPGNSIKLSSIKYADHFLSDLDNGKEVKVYGIYSDNSSRILNNVKFFSFQPNIAKVVNGKLLLPGLPGTANIEAVAGSFRSTLTVNVTKPLGNQVPLFLKLSGNLDSFEKTKEIKALAVYPDGRQIDVTGEAVWNTTNTNIAVLKDKGKAEIAGNGPVRISASYNNLNGFLSNKSYSQFGSLHPIKTQLVPLAEIKKKVQDKLSNSQALPVPSDIYGHWAEQDIKQAMRLGWMGGYSDGTIKPDSPMSRGEFASVLERALLLRSNNRTVTYNDTDGHWAKESIHNIANLGVTPIDPSRRFRPNDPITRGEIAQMINSLIQVRADSYYQFMDVPSNHASATAIANTTQAGIMAGMGGLNFGPAENATRAQALAVLLRLLKTDPEMDGLLNRYK
ncbi:MAG: S-layer homology domain-containing protein [Bacillota bacterium]